MLRLHRDIDELFARGKRLRYRGKIGVRYLVRKNAKQEMPQLFLFVVPKRFVRHAHERNTIKRWLREVIQHSDIVDKLGDALRQTGQQMLISLRVEIPPSTKINWDIIRISVDDAALELHKIVTSGE